VAELLLFNSKLISFEIFKWIKSEINAIRKEIETLSDDDQDKATTAKVNKYGPKVQLYDPSDLTKVARVFPSITEAVRGMENSSYTSIKIASMNKQVYMGYRWKLIESTCDPMKVQDIGETVDKQTRTIDYIIMLNLEGTEILKVFGKQKEAAEHVDQCASVICTAIKHNRPMANYMWTTMSNVDKKLMSVWLKTNSLPTVVPQTRGTRVEQIDPNTDKVIKVHPSMADVIKEFQMTSATIKAYAKSGQVYKMFKWKILV